MKAKPGEHKPARLGKGGEPQDRSCWIAQTICVWESLNVLRKKSSACDEDAQLGRPQGEIRGRGWDINVYCNSTKGHSGDSYSSTANNNTQIRLTSPGTVRPLIFCWEKKKKRKEQQVTRILGGRRHKSRMNYLFLLCLGLKSARQVLLLRNVTAFY